MSGRALFVFVPALSRVQVVNTKKREVIFTWPVSSQRNGDGAIDEKTHRLFIETRTPLQMIAMNSRTGKERQAGDTRRRIVNAARQRNATQEVLPSLECGPRPGQRPGTRLCKPLDRPHPLRSIRVSPQAAHERFRE